MSKNPFELPGSDLLKQSKDFFQDKKDTSAPSSDSPLKNKWPSLGSMGKKTQADRGQTPLEPLDAPELVTQEEKKPKEPQAKLSDGAWKNPSTKFQEEAEVSVKVTLPPGKEHITRVEAELYAKRPSGSELIAKGEGHAQADGTATITLPVYKPNGHSGEPVDYFLAFKHKLADILKPESLLRKISETALKSADHILVPGICFEKNTSFIRPNSAEGMKALESRFKEWEKKYPKGKIVVYGHANADEKEPKFLSERRGQSAYSFITNDADKWETIYQKEKWGLRILQIILNDLGHYRGSPDGIDGNATQSAFKIIQKQAGVPETGKEDTATRKALFKAYMQGKHDIKLDANRFRMVAGNPWMGCSHFNQAKESDKDLPENRRVAFVLINESKFFPVHFPCQDGSEAGCQGQCKKAGKRSSSGTQCLFYDELVRESKQDKTNEDEPEVTEIPWMTFAEQEARRWKGKTEDEISKSINYHAEVGVHLNDLVGKTHAWCASFVNYCLKQAGFPLSTPPSRAASFLHDPHFVKIDGPIFGAIAIIETHHACFVFADDKNSDKPVVLGGNQSDQINFTVFHEHISYFLPKGFDKSKSKIPPLKQKTAAELNQEFGIAVHSKSGDNTR